MDRDEETPQRRSIGARRSPATAEAILDAAEAVLREAGYAGFSIEAVARKARAGKPTIYRWWPSKAALMLDVYHRQKRDVVHPDTGSLETDLLDFLSSLLRHWRETPSGGIFRSIIAEAQLDEAASEAVAAYAEERMAHIAEMFEKARERGELAAHAEPRAAAELVHAVAWTRLLQNRLQVGDGELRPVVRSLLHGVVRPPG